MQIPMKLNFSMGNTLIRLHIGAFHNIVVCNDGVYVGVLTILDSWEQETLQSLPLQLRLILIKCMLKISCGYHHTIAVCDNGVFGWGNNAYKQLGINDLHNTLSPIRLEQFDDKLLIKFSVGIIFLYLMLKNIYLLKLLFLQK